MFPCLSAIAIFLKTVYSFLSPFFYRFAGCFLLYLKYSVYFRNINPLFIYVTNIFSQVIIVKLSLFCIFSFFLRAGVVQVYF